MRSNFDPKILESTIKYDVAITSNSILVNNLIDHLTKICLDDKPNDKKSSREALKRHLLNLTCNLFNCYKSEKHFLAYPRANTPDDKTFYSKNDDDNPEKITIYHLKKIIAMLEKNGYLENINGFIDRERKRSRNSRIRATDKLIRLFYEYKIALKHIIDNPNKPVLVLKDSEKKKIDYHSDDNTKMMIDDTQNYNKLIARAKIFLNGEEIPIPIVQRVFNNSSFHQGGRFYGGRWQECNSNYRKKITINGHTTEEQDYSCFHLRMLYHMESINPENNLYSLDSYPRNHVKQAINIALNCSSRSQTKHAVLKELRKNDNSIQMDYVDKLIQLVIQKHGPVSQFFFTGTWAELQYYDSCITRDILNEFTNSGQIVLPVHDSYIVETKNSEQLKQLMNDFYKIRFHFDPDVIKK